MYLIRGSVGAQALFLSVRLRNKKKKRLVPGAYLAYSTSDIRYIADTRVIGFSLGYRIGTCERSEIASITYTVVVYQIGKYKIKSPDFHIRHPVS